jgi:hypothetical protein
MNFPENGVSSKNVGTGPIMTERSVIEAAAKAKKTNDQRKAGRGPQD